MNICKCMIFLVNDFPLTFQLFENSNEHIIFSFILKKIIIKKCVHACVQMSFSPM